MYKFKTVVIADLWFCSHKLRLEPLTVFSLRFGGRVYPSGSNCVFYFYLQKIFDNSFCILSFQSQLFLKWIPSPHPPGSQLTLQAVDHWPNHLWVFNVELRGCDRMPHDADRSFQISALSSHWGHGRDFTVFLLHWMMNAFRHCLRTRKRVKF